MAASLQPAEPAVSDSSPSHPTPSPWRSSHGGVGGRARFHALLITRMWLSIKRLALGIQNKTLPKREKRSHQPTRKRLIKRKLTKLLRTFWKELNSNCKGILESLKLVVVGGGEFIWEWYPHSGCIHFWDSFADDNLQHFKGTYATL